MERLAGQDVELRIDEENDNETVALLEAGRPLRWRVKAGLVTAVAAVGLASLALAMAPWHRGAAIVGGNPQQQGQGETKLLHSLNSHQTDRYTMLTKAVSAGDTEINVMDSSIFMAGDVFNLMPQDDSADAAESAVVESVEEGKVILKVAVTKSFSAYSPVIVPTDNKTPPPSTTSAAPTAVPTTSEAPLAKEASYTEAPAPTEEDSGGLGLWWILLLLLGLLLCCLCCFAGAKYFGMGAMTKGQEKASQWIFKPVDDQAIIALESPSFESPESGQVVQPGELIKVIEKQPPMTTERFTNGGEGVEMKEDLGEGDVLFLKLKDGRGWVLDREPGNDMCFELFTFVDQVWKFDPVKSGGDMPILTEPKLEGATTGATLRPGDKFKVSEIQAFRDNGTLFLKLADGRGWVYDQQVENGERLCKRIVEEMWKYEPPNGAPMGIRKYPEMELDRKDFSHHKLQPDEKFEVEEVVIGDKENNRDLLFLKLSDGRGWAYNKHPQLGQMCHRVY